MDRILRWYDIIRYRFHWTPNHVACNNSHRPMRYDLQQLAESIGMSVNTVRSWRYRYMNRLPLSPDARAICSMMVTVGSKVQIDSEDLRNWLADKKNKLRSTNLPTVQIRELEARAQRLANYSRERGADLAADAFELGAKLLTMELNETGNECLPKP